MIKTQSLNIKTAQSKMRQSVLSIRFLSQFASRLFNQKNSLGHTLTNLMMTIGIIGAVGVLSIPRFEQGWQHTKDVSLAHGLKQVHIKMEEIYMNFNNQYPEEADFNSTVVPGSMEVSAAPPDDFESQGVNVLAASALGNELAMLVGLISNEGYEVKYVRSSIGDYKIDILKDGYLIYYVNPAGVFVASADAESADDSTPTSAGSFQMPS